MDPSRTSDTEENLNVYNYTCDELQPLFSIVRLEHSPSVCVTSGLSGVKVKVSHKSKPQ